MTNALPDLVRAHVARVDARLPVFLTEARDRLLPLSSDLQPALDELVLFLQGGKRLRGALLLLGHELAGGDPADVIGPAVACELLQACALLHDDWIDAADTRRGRPAAHVAFAARHRAAGWHGDPDHYGAAIAVLLGDLAFALGDRAFMESSVAADRLVAGLGQWHLLREEVMAGQTLDVDAAAAQSTDPDVALHIARLKSGRYSVTRPLQTGALLAGADGPVVAALRDIGEPLGLAFQLRDDLLGVFGDERFTGKPASGDLLEGKRTFLVTTAAARLAPDERAVLLTGLGVPGLDDDDLERLRRLLRSSGAVEVVQQRIDDEVAAARTAVAALPPDLAPGPRAALDELGDWITTRRA